MLPLRRCVQPPRQADTQLADAPACGTQLRGERDALAGLSLEQLEALQAEQEAAVQRTRDAANRAREVAAVVEAMLCNICQELSRDTVLNCGHTFCGECAGRMTTCPQRCGAITGRYRMFL